MAKNFCLSPEQTQKFLKGLKEGKINPEKLADMDSDARRVYLSEYVGERTAAGVNALFEEKLLLKNFKEGAITWAKNVGGLKPEARKDLVSRIEKLEKVLNPTEQKAFLKDLAEQKLGIGVSIEEAKHIAELSAKITEAKKDRSTPEKNKVYGDAVVDLRDYINGLKDKSVLDQLKENPIATIAGTGKSIQASMDNSAVFRQGWRSMFTDPKEWGSRSIKSFGDIGSALKDPHAVEKAISSDLISRKNADRYKKMELAINTREEAFPTSLPEKIPLFGRVYKASELAYSGFLYRLRADLADKYLDIAEKSGVNINDPQQLKAIGKIINSLTGRAHLGKAEPAANFVNNVFFSPRSVKANFDSMTAHLTDSGMTSFARKKAATNLAKILIGQAAIIAIANSIRPNSAETDPRSSDFGKIKVGNTRFDISGGSASLFTLAARIAKGSSKSTETGKITKQNTGAFGSKTTSEVIGDFLSNKASPAVSLIKELLNHTDFSGNKVTAPQALLNFVTPLPVSNIKELKDDPKSAGVLLGTIADGLGIATNTYGSPSVQKGKNFLGDLSNTENGKTILNEAERLSKTGNAISLGDVEVNSTRVQSYKDQVSEDRYNSTLDNFKKNYATNVARLIRSSEYRRAKDDKKSSMIQSIKEKALDDALARGGYKKPKK